MLPSKNGPHKFSVITTAFNTDPLKKKFPMHMHPKILMEYFIMLQDIYNS